MSIETIDNTFKLQFSPDLCSYDTSHQEQFELVPFGLNKNFEFNEI